MLLLRFICTAMKRWLWWNFDYLDIKNQTQSYYDAVPNGKYILHVCFHIYKPLVHYCTQILVKSNPFVYVFIFKVERFKFSKHSISPQPICLAQQRQCMAGGKNETGQEFMEKKEDVEGHPKSIELQTRYFWSNLWSCFPLREYQNRRSTLETKTCLSWRPIPYNFWLAVFIFIVKTL